MIKATPKPLPIAVNAKASKIISTKPLRYMDGKILIIELNIFPITLVAIIANSPKSTPGK